MKIENKRERENRIDSHREIVLYRFSEGIVPEDGSLSCWLLSDDDYHWERLALEEEKVLCLLRLHLAHSHSVK